MDNQTALELTKVLSSIVELQIKQAKAISILVAHSGVQAEVDSVKNLADDEDAQSFRSLREKLGIIAHQLSRPTNLPSTKS